MQATNNTGLREVLALTPFQQDRAFLRTIIGHYPWTLFKADHLAAVLGLLRRHQIGIVFCELDLMPGSWTDLLEHINDLPHPPSVIVTSRLADDRLWAEALNLGAWDVLAKPFDRGEVLRSADAAWQHWHNHTDLPSAARTVKKAAS
jgi:DNA-binding NtrC family response regulator